MPGDPRVNPRAGSKEGRVHGGQAVLKTVPSVMSR